MRKFFEEEQSVVYYVNTDDWKENSRFTSILANYHVDEEPILVKLLHVAISRVGFDFAMRFEAGPDLSLLGKVGIRTGEG